MEDAGQKLKRVRERLNLRYRDVEDASQQIAERYGNDEFAVALSRLADIENKGVVPTIFRIYSLCVIYRLDYAEVLEWYGVNPGRLPADSGSFSHPATHRVTFTAQGNAEAILPISLDPGLDFSKTTYLTRHIQRWGKVPLALLSGLPLRSQTFAFVGAEDWFMFPLIQPGSFIAVDDSKRKIATEGWLNEYDRPIYLLELDDGEMLCAWCAVDEDRIIATPHPSSTLRPRVLPAHKVNVVGEVVGVATRLDLGRKRRPRS
jgi:hypothetical protein